MKRKKYYIISAIILAIVVSMITYTMQVGFIKTAPKSIIENNLNTYKNFFDINLSNSWQTLN